MQAQKIIVSRSKEHYIPPMTAHEIKNLPMEEKIQIMELLWEDFRERFEKCGIPDRHTQILDERRERERKGEAQLLDWDSVKETIGRK